MNYHRYQMKMMPSGIAGKLKDQLALFVMVALLGLLGNTCTNYSSDQQIVNSPILLDVQPEGTGHYIKVAAQNVEIGFLGYRLYEAADEKTLRSTPVENGIDCGPFEIQPTNSIEYILEVKPGQSAVSVADGTRVCAFNASLSSGRYIAVRSLIFSLTAVGTSEISNALRVP